MEPVRFATFQNQLQIEMGACGSAASAPPANIERVNPLTLAQLAGRFAGRLECSVDESALTTCVCALGEELFARGGSDMLVRVYRRDEATGSSWVLDGDLVGHTDIIKVLAMVPGRGEPTGRWKGAGLASAGLDSSVRLWCDGAESAVLLGHTSTVTELRVVPQNTKLLISASRDGTARVWSLDDDVQLHVLDCAPRGPVNALALVPLGAELAVVTGTDDGSLCLWDLATGAAHAHVDGAHSARVKSVATFQSLLASSSSDNSVKLWRAVEGTDAAGARRGRLELAQALSGHLEAVTTLLQLRLVNDGEALASDDGTEGETLDGRNVPSEFLGETLDGSTALVSLSTDKMVKVWARQDPATLRRLRARGRTPGQCGCATTCLGHTRAPTSAVALRCGMVATGACTPLRFRWRTARERRRVRGSTLVLTYRVPPSLPRLRTAARAFSLAVQRPRSSIPCACGNSASRTTGRLRTSACLSSSRNRARDSRSGVWPQLATASSSRGAAAASFTSTSSRERRARACVYDL